MPHGEYDIDLSWIGLTRLVNGIFFAVLVLVLTGGGVALMFAVSGLAQVAIVVAWLILVGIALVHVTVWPRYEHRWWSYEVAPEVLRIRHGVVWRSTVAIPIARIQHVDIHRGPLERKWGLASLKIHTAGTRDAVHTIPGLTAEVAERLRDRLIETAARIIRKPNEVSANDE